MTCNFRVGQKVVLVEPYEGDSILRAFVNGDILPFAEVIYTVREILPEEDGYVFIRLEEIVNHSDSFGEASFNAARFRPVAKRKTDISIFKALLTPSKEQVSA